jgi:two-component system, chemotaxis family, sensor kinase CheA
MIEKIRDLFIEEATLQLSTIESLLESHTKGILKDDLVEKVFFAMHSIKGAGPMVGFTSLPFVTAPVEKVFARIRKGEINISDELVVKTNSVVRLVIDALKSNSDNHIAEGDDKEELINYFKNLSS